jgi:hypothetical protein
MAGMRFFAEFILSHARFFAALRMTIDKRIII